MCAGFWSKLELSTQVSYHRIIIPHSPAVQLNGVVKMTRCLDQAVVDGGSSEHRKPWIPDGQDQGIFDDMPETLYSWPQTLAIPIFKVCAKHSNMVGTRTSTILLGLMVKSTGAFAEFTMQNTFPAAMGSFLVFPTISRFPIAPVPWRTSVAKVSSPACLGVRSKPW